LVLVDHQIDLVSDQIDLAIRFGSAPGGEMTVTKLAPRSFKVCASPDYVERHGRLKHPLELQQRDCVLFPLPGYRTQWLFRRGNEPSFPAPVKGRLLVSHGLTMTACAVASLGPALLPDWLCNEELETGTLVDLFPDYECAATEFETAAWLVHPSRSYVPTKVRAFIEFLETEVRSPQ
jgi:DNA-binding transcriptional LysR family regulator